MKTPRNSQLPASTANRARVGRRSDSGYAYLMALFMVLTLVITSQVVLRNMVTEARSRRDEDMIWRGNQYIRAIRMYYRKTGHYPQKEEDLVKGVPNLHFLRAEAMKDPMNKNDDGEWGFIYTNAAGQIFGSSKYGSLQEMVIMDMNGGKMPGTPQDANGMGSSGQNSSASSSSSGTSSAAPGVASDTPAGQTPSTGGLPAFGQAGAGVFPKPTGPVDNPIIGGQLSGVVSKADGTPVRVYKGGKTYKEWEFIWNPLEEQARAVQQGLGGTQQPVGAIPGLPIGPGGVQPPANGPANNNPNAPGAPPNGPAINAP